MVIEILGADGVVRAVLCSLCDAPQRPDAVDYVDLGQGPGLPVCCACVAGHDADAAGRDPGEPMPWELGYQDAANDNDCDEMAAE